VFKLGIVTTEELDRPRTRLGARKFASLLLLRDLRGRGARDATHYNGILRLLQMANGTWKDTFRGRFARLDRESLEVIAASHASGSRLQVTDLAVASGITSVDFYLALRSKFEVDFVATDLWRDAFAVTGMPPGGTVVLDADGGELQFVLGRFVLPGYAPDRLIYPVNRALRWWARRTLLPRARTFLQGVDQTHLRAFETLVNHGAQVTRIPLVSAECLDLLATRPDFRFVVANILAPPDRQSDVIRAMNIVTPDHLPQADLRKAIRNCLAALRPQGVLILGRSPNDNPEDVTATIYQAQNGDLHTARRLNAGCEVEELVEQERLVLKERVAPGRGSTESRP
jgi:SAM-dependent methyltransferase